MKTFTVSLSDAITRFQSGNLLRCEIKRSPQEEGCLNVVVFAEYGGNHFALKVEGEDGSVLEIVNYDYAVQVALSIGFTVDQLDLNIY